MAKRRNKNRRNRNNHINKQNNNTQHVQKNTEPNISFSEPEQIGGLTIVEEKISDNGMDLEVVERNPAKPLEKDAKEKIKSMPQTYVEDTFNVHNNDSDKKVIENKVAVRSKQFITKDELVSSTQFKSKLERLISRIKYKKSFNELLDFVRFSKLYRTYHIDDTTDEVDILLHEIVLYFKVRLRRITLVYEDYEKINAYFESLRSLYRRFNHGEGSIKDGLKQELEKLEQADSFIRQKLFAKFDDFS